MMRGQCVIDPNLDGAIRLPSRVGYSVHFNPVPDIERKAGRHRTDVREVVAAVHKFGGDVALDFVPDLREIVESVEAAGNRATGRGDGVRRLLGVLSLVKKHGPAAYLELPT